MSEARSAPLRVCFPFVGDDFGGSHISALKLVGALDRRRVTPVVVNQCPEGPLADYLEAEKIPHLTLALPRLPVRGGSAKGAALDYLRNGLPLIRRFLREGEFDIVHTNDGRVHATWGLAARLAGKRVVWHHRGDPQARGANWLAPILAHRMVTVSRFAHPSRPLLPMAGRSSVVHSPFDRPPAVPDRAAAKAALLAELSLAPGTRVLSYFGGLIERKRPLLFVEAVAALRAARPDLALVGCLFGVSSPLGTDFETLVRARAEALGLGDAIRLMGYRSPVEPLMAASDALLVPAWGEPFGRTLIEAMFLGTPVVATRHGGNPEAIEDGRNGFLVEPENPAAFVAPVLRLLDDPALFGTIAAEARARALRSYGIDVHVEQIMAVYARALKGGAPARRPVRAGLSDRDERSPVS